MTTTEQPTDIDMEKLMGFVFRAVDEVGASLNTALVVMGDRLGVYRALADAGPLKPAELAQRTGTAERYAREWLNGQAAGAFVEYDPDSGRHTLPAEHAIALTDESSPACLPGFFQIALGSCNSHWCCQAVSGSVEWTLIRRTECLPAVWHFQPNLPAGVRQLLSGG